MKTKIKKLLFEYSENSRITTKELGKKIGASQQSAFYLLNTFRKKKIISPAVLVDAIKLGYTNVIVGFNFLKNDSYTRKEIVDELKKVDSIIAIEEGKEGIDLIVEYSCLNLSAFNKIHSEIIYKFFKKLRTTFVFPIIVIREYSRRYLTKKYCNRDVILSGDRELKELNENELKVLDELVDFPEKKIIDISDSLKMNVKSVIKIKKSLEKKFIIKGYGAVFNHLKLSVNRQMIFLRFSGEGGVKDIDKFNDYAKNNKNIVKFVKLIGEYQVLVFVESLKEIEIIKDIRTSFPIESYLIIKSDKMHKKRYLPKQTYLK